ncbi:MAG: serine/threonine-protein phosphatase [Kiritimatiellae bacterium]|nr:serine/threonine-protein phosphatase [Kiritimatiellia bacterium]
MLLDWFRQKRRVYTIESASLSDRGLVRADNQDHVVAYRGRASFCVADGMGGGEGGAKASELVCRHFVKAVVARRGFADRIRRVAEAIDRANADIRDFADGAGYRQMGSTVAALVLDEGASFQAIVAHVGDSRVYRYRAGVLEQLTRDHTMASELTRRACGATAAAALAGRTSVLSHVLTRAIGIEDTVKVDWRRVDFRAGDQFLVCSDGVYDMIDHDGIRKAFAQGGRPRDVVERLAAGVVRGGAADNYSIVVLRIGAKR